MSHRWEDGAAGGSARGAGCCPAERAAARGSRRPQLPLESPTAAERGERSSVCPRSSCIPTVCSSLSAVHLRILPWLPFPRGCLPKRETRHCSHRWHCGCWWPVWVRVFSPSCLLRNGANTGLYQNITCNSSCSNFIILHQEL